MERRQSCVIHYLEELGDQMASNPTKEKKKLKFDGRQEGV